MRNTSIENAPSDAARGPLAEQLLSPATFPAFLEDAKTVIAEEIRGRGMTLRTAFKVTRKLKPDIVERMVRELSPDFVAALEPCYADYRASTTTDLYDYLLAHEAEVRDAMLAAADARARRIHSRAIHSAYGRIRGRAEREIAQAMPRIAAVIARHAG